MQSITTTTTTALAPHRCFLQDLPKLFESQKHTTAIPKVRVMGMVVSITHANSYDEDEEDNEPLFSYSMMDQEDFLWLELDDGTGTILCKATVTMVDRLEMPLGQTLDCIGELQATDESILFLHADTLLEVSPPVAEQLRWLELTTTTDQRAPCGYPCRETTSEDIWEIMDSNQGEGVSVADLALVLDLRPEQVQPLIEDLQLQGLIYENETGSYVPL
jgi:hypothetical protein